jgi:hypothetical protein
MLALRLGAFRRVRGSGVVLTGAIMATCGPEPCWVGFREYLLVGPGPPAMNGWLPAG